jgi:hypothetical protein
LALQPPPDVQIDTSIVAQYFGPLLLHQRSWIYRRVQTLEILSDRRSHRRTSVDFVIPEFVIHQARSTRAPIASRYIVLPIALPLKEPLRQFDVVDDTGRRVPVLDAIENVQLGEKAFRRVARQELTLVGARLSEPIKQSIHDLVAERSSGKGARLYQELLQLLRSDEGNLEYATLLGSWRFMALAWDLSASFALSVVLQADIGQRVILRYWAEDRYQPVPRHPAWTLVRRALTLWRGPSFDFSVPVANAGSAASYHLEIPAPPGTFASDAILGTRTRNLSDGTKGPQVSLDRQTNVEVVHFIAYNIRRGSDTAVFVRFRVHAAGLLTPMLFSAGLSLLIFVVGAVLARVGIRSQADAPTVIILAVSGLWSASFVRPTEHRLITSLAFKVRVMMAIVTATTFAGAGVVGVTLPTDVRWWSWFGLMCVTFLAVVSISIAWFDSWHVWSDRHVED